MLKITKSSKEISFAWEKDDEPGKFEQLQENIEFRNTISKYIQVIPVTINSTEVVLKLIDIIDRGSRVSNIDLKGIEAIFNDFFDISLHISYNLNNKAGLTPNFSKITKFRESTNPSSYDIDSDNLLMDDEGYLYYSIDGELHSARIVFSSDTIIVSSRVKQCKSKSLVKVLKNIGYKNVDELLKDLDIEDNIPAKKRK